MHEQAAATSKLVYSRLLHFLKDLVEVSFHLCVLNGLLLLLLLLLLLFIELLFTASLIVIVIAS